MANLNIDNPRYPLYLQPSVALGNVIIQVRLTGTENYFAWSRAIKIALQAKHKLGFINGTCTKTQFNVDLGEEQERVNATILTWIMNMVSPKLVNGIVYTNNTHEVWTELQDRFEKINGSKIYNRHREIATITQGTSNIYAYHSRVKLLWDEYGVLIPSLPITLEMRDFIDHLE